MKTANVTKRHNDQTHLRREASASRREEERLVYARHGRECMGCKSPVGGSPSWEVKYLRLTTSPRQGRRRAAESEGSRRPRGEARDTNGREGSRPADEVAPYTAVG